MQLNWQATIVLVVAFIALGVCVKFNVSGAGVALVGVCLGVVQYFQRPGLSRSIPPPPPSPVPSAPPTKKDIDNAN